ncbi:MAG: prepilin-type N-terminal cleavage/methylation domain-containing protein [Pseudomonadota bacterium]
MMHTTVQTQRRQSGFTLIEVMLATALIAIIMALAYSGFRAGVRATTSGEDRIEETNRIRLAHEFVRRQISLAQPLIIEQDEDGQSPPIRFEGDGDRIRLVAPLPGYLGFGGPYVQEFRLERGEEGMDLVFAFAMLNTYEPGNLDLDPPVTLLENVGDVQFEFLGFTEDSEDVFWSNYWEEPERMPLAISMQMDLPRDNGLFWPTLTTPLRVDNASGAAQRRAEEDMIMTPIGPRPLRPNERDTR